MKGNERKSAFICFHKLFRIGTFQWVTADSNKKIFSFRTRGERQIALRRGAPEPFIEWNLVTWISGFCKVIVDRSVFPAKRTIAPDPAPQGRDETGQGSGRRERPPVPIGRPQAPG
jgi:hypothetical protein